MISFILFLTFYGTVGYNLAPTYIGQFLILVTTLTFGLISRFEEPCRILIRNLHNKIFIWLDCQILDHSLFIINKFAYPIKSIIWYLLRLLLYILEHSTQTIIINIILPYPQFIPSPYILLLFDFLQHSLNGILNWNFDNLYLKIICLYFLVINGMHIFVIQLQISYMI